MKFFSLFSVLTILVLLIYFFGFSGNTILKASQPDTVTYDTRYELRIKEGLRKIQFFDFRRFSEVMVSRQGNDFAYGHGIDIDIDILGSEILKTKIEWLKSGINLKFDSGHVLFIPKKSFEGGR